MTLVKLYKVEKSERNLQKVALVQQLIINHK